MLWNTVPEFWYPNIAHIVFVENVGHILAVFPTVHFSKSTFLWSSIRPQKSKPAKKQARRTIVYHPWPPSTGLRAPNHIFLPFRGNSVPAKTATWIDSTPTSLSLFDATSYVLPVVSTSSIKITFLPLIFGHGRSRIELRGKDLRRIAVFPIWGRVHWCLLPCRALATVYPCHFSLCWQIATSGSRPIRM